MRLKINQRFSKKLLAQVKYIAEDKPEAAAKFYADVLKSLQELKQFPLKHRQSIYAEDENVRDLIFKGYTITYRINYAESCIEVFSLLKHQKS